MRGGKRPRLVTKDIRRKNHSYNLCVFLNNPVSK